MEEEKRDEKKKSKEHEDRDYPAEEQGILPKETSEEIRRDMETGEKEADAYTKEGREEAEENGEMEPWEAGFMEGATGGGQLGKDALTGEPLMDIEDVVELEFDGELYRFVNEENATKFREKKEKEKE
ncbi:hypothetical protein HOC13_03710 [Candidatus Woesearchaeota archaeon]|jgi:hypothetical protein|nr:hypothetical protein [Candidatus Woesearchaeota archaeon]